MTIDDTKHTLKLLLAAYPTQRSRMTPADLRAMLEIWSLALADVALEDARAAVQRIVMTHKWLPSIAEFREEIGTVHHGVRRSGLEAWGDVRGLLAYRNADDTSGVDPVVLEICKRYGWIETRTLTRNGVDLEQWHVVTGENESSDRIRFAELYDKLTADGRKAAQLAPGAVNPMLPQRGAPGQISSGSAAQRVLDSLPPAREDDH